jgi:hypothetical protein
MSDSPTYPSTLSPSVWNFPNVYRHVSDTDLADVDLLQESIHDLELTIAADPLCEPAARDRFDIEEPSRLVRDDRDSRTGIEYESERLVPVINS